MKKTLILMVAVMSSVVLGYGMTLLGLDEKTILIVMAAIMAPFLIYANYQIYRKR